MNVSESDIEKREQFFSSNRILFLYPEVASASSFSVSNKHLGASYIRAYLKANHIPTSQFTVEGSLNLYELIERLLKEDPAVLCVTVYDCTYHTVKMIVKELKIQKPRLMVILGGPTATFSDNVIMEDFQETDLCVRGEGEYTLYEILDAYYHGRDYSEIKALTFRCMEHGEIIRNPDRDLIRGRDKESELDILPSPYLEKIISPSEGLQIGIITSRGCVFKCVYCNFSAMSRWTVRFHSVERVMAELIHIAQHQKDGKKVSVAIQDDAFTLNKKRAKEICRRIIDSGLKLEIDCETRADAVDRELLELMHHAGFKDLHFGVESGSPKVLREIKKVRSLSKTEKGFEPEKKFLQKITEGVSTAVEFDLKPTVSIILGLPSETREEGLESIKFIASLDKCRYYHNYLEIFAGTELFETHEQYGIGLKKVYCDAVNRLYKTTYAYDVSSVPIIEERSLFSSKVQSTEMAARFCGDPYMFEQVPNERYPSLVVFTNTIFPNHASINWLLKNAGSDTRVAFLWQMDNDDSKPDSTGFYEMHMPLQMFYWLMDRHPDADESELFEEAFSRNSDNFTHYHFFFFYIGDHEIQRAMFDSSANDAQYIFQIQEKSMGRGYYREVEKLLYIRDMLYRYEVSNINFLDVCRWSPVQCPALTLERVVVDSNSDLYPCLSGRPVGKIGEQLYTVKNRIATLSARVQNARGCAICPMEASCSKCLFPYPMSAAEFCRIQLRRSI
jgi:radical SAM superfamily enzyme YgiQ (UPF0313 family)